MTQSQSVSQKRFYQCVNPKQKLTFRHSLSTFGFLAVSRPDMSLTPELTKDFKNCQNLIKMSSDFYFTLTFQKMSALSPIQHRGYFGVGYLAGFFRNVLTLS